MATQQEESEELTYGDRFPGGHDDPFFRLYQKAVELGTWNVESVIEDAPVEKDRQQWEAMDRPQRILWSEMVGSFLNGEHNVAADASKLVQMVDSPYLERTSNKEAFYSTLQFEEVKHTQFCAWYAENVVPDEIFERLGRGSRKGLFSIRNPTVGNLTEKERDVLNTAVATKEPHDIARAATIYGLHVEGLTARNAFRRMKALAKDTPLPTWIQAFELISTDEGRHITAQAELVRELIEHEQEGKAAYQGVGETVWNQLLEDMHVIAGEEILGGVYIVATLADEEFTDEEYEREIDDHVDQILRFATDMYRDTIGLPEYDEDRLREHVYDSLEQIRSDIDEETDFLSQLEADQRETQELIAQEDDLGLADD